ncbi:MAG: hypothetical protein WCA98_05285 [Candidatus Acidiferrales bacterium]
MLWMILFLFFQSAPSAPKQDVPLPPTKVLDLTSSQSLPIPFSRILGECQCDDSGSIYFIFLPDKNAIRIIGAVKKISPDPLSQTLFAIPADLASGDAKTKETFAAFRVTPSGKLWFLDRSPSGYFLVGFNDDGTVSSHTRLEVSDFVWAREFLISNSGTVLLPGYYTKNASANVRGKRFFALFAKSGRLRADLANEAGSDVDLKSVNVTESDSVGAAGPDGNFYFPRGNEILVISEFGDMVRRIPLPRENLGEIVSRIDLSGGLLSLEFLVPMKDHPERLRPHYLVLEAATGEPFGVYEAGDDVGGAMACFSARNGYQYLVFDNGMIKLTTARLK